MKTIPAGDLDSLQREWPQWRLRTSRSDGLVCATRRRQLTWRGLALTLIADDVAVLAGRLQEQQEKEDEDQAEVECLPMA